MGLSSAQLEVVRCLLQPFVMFGSLIAETKDLEAAISIIIVMMMVTG